LPNAHFRNPYDQSWMSRPCSASGRSGYWTSYAPTRWRWFCHSARFGHAATFRVRRDWVQPNVKSSKRSNSDTERCRDFLVQRFPAKLCEIVRHCAKTCDIARNHAVSDESKTVYWSPRSPFGRSHSGPVSASLRQGFAIYPKDSETLAEIPNSSQSLRTSRSPSRSVVKNRKGSQIRSVRFWSVSGGIRLCVIQMPWGGLSQAGREFLTDRSVLQNAGEGER